MPEIGIIIVTYNSAAVIGSCLEAACATGAAIVVVDNASTDATLTVVKRHPVQVVANPANCGFAAAVNQGFAALNTAYVLLLNPDTVLASSLDPLREACDLPRAGGASGRLLDHEGNPQIGFMVRELPTAMALILEILLLNRLWPGNPINVKYRCKRW
ncbi:MAG TPA: glycosyltransferase, partial [Bryobacteraceae bacterium]|nr:glycosyltransferase [Bryobacteraceae bacterium]